MDIQDIQSAENGLGEPVDRALPALKAARAAIFEKGGATGVITWRDPGGLRAGSGLEGPIDDWVHAACAAPPVGNRPGPVGFQRDFRLLDGQGTPHWFEARAQVVSDSEGGRQWVGLLLDLNPRKEAEERLRDEFIGILAHELRNPLSPILTSAQLLRRHGREQPELLEPACASIERQVRNLTRVIGELSDFSRIGRGKLELAPAAVELDAALGGVVDTLRPVLEKQRQEVAVAVTGGPLRVWADPDRLGQVLDQVLKNALKFTPAGGRIRVAAVREDGRVAISVKDAGIGIDPALLEQVFEPFVQLGRPLHGSNGGLGIGLALARRLVELQGGEITAASAGQGQGSEFVIRLPSA